MKPHEYIEKQFKDIEKNETSKEAITELKKKFDNNHELTTAEIEQIKAIHHVLTKKPSRINKILFFIGFTLIGLALLFINIYDITKKYERMLLVLTIISVILSTLTLVASTILSAIYFKNNKNKENKDFLILELAIAIPLIIIIVVTLCTL